MSDFILKVLAKALVGMAIFAAFAIAKKYLSVSKLEIPAHSYTRQDLDIRFRGMQWAVGVCMLAVGIFFAFGTYTALIWGNRYLTNADGPYLYGVSPQSATWWFLPGFAALILPWEITLQLWSRFGNRDDANLYSYWSNLSAGFDCRRMFRWLAVLIVLPVGVLTFLQLPVHTVLRQNDIRECGYAFAQCSTYLYADANRMTKIQGFRNRDGSVTRRAGIVVDFNDGRRWFSSDISDFTATVDPTLAQLLTEKTHLSLEHAQTEDDISKSDSSPGRRQR